jgi:hypothetical protein
MVQLVFTHAISSTLVALGIAMVNGVITDLQTSDGIAIMDRRCPTLEKTRWVYLVDVLRYILSYRGIINEVRGILEHDPTPESFTRLYWIILPLKLFSLAAECRECKFHGEFPLAAEVAREFDQICLSLLGTPEAAILNSVSVHESECIQLCYHCLGTQGTWPQDDSRRQYTFHDADESSRR